MRPPTQCVHTSHAVRGPMGAPTKAPSVQFTCGYGKSVAQFTCAPATHYGTPSHVSWPHRELH
eukprot:3764495-Pyramimonas_sp.AAC.1